MPSKSPTRNLKDDEPESQPRPRFNHAAAYDSLPELTNEYLRSLSEDELFEKLNGARRRLNTPTHMRREAKKDYRRIEAELLRRKPGRTIITVDAVHKQPRNSASK